LAICEAKPVANFFLDFQHGIISFNAIQIKCLGLSMQKVGKLCFVTKVPEKHLSD